MNDVHAQTPPATERVTNEDWNHYANRVEREHRAQFGESLGAYQIAIPVEKTHIVAYDTGSVTARRGWRNAMEEVAMNWQHQQRPAAPRPS